MTLIQEYMPGQSLPPHTDQFGDIVIGINLLANTDMTFVNPKTKEEIMVGLTRRGIYVLTGESRFVWKHGLMNITKRRISLTVRNLFVNQDKLKK
jgi:alkylated DNA repair dioxygenase AlkB